MRLAATLLLAFCSAARAATLDVPGQYATIQAALDAAHAGDTIVVQPGTYAEALVLPVFKCSLLAPGGAAVTTVQATGLDASVVWSPGSTAQRIVQGFTLTGGSGIETMPGQRFGGGVYAPSSTGLVLRECRIVGNTALGTAAGKGGGVYGALQLENCEVSGNTARDGGGVAMQPPAYTTSITLTGCTVSGNVAQVEGGGVYGTCALTDCTIFRNVAAIGGGLSAHSSIGFTRVVFLENSAGTGGGCAVSGIGDAAVSGGTFIRNRASDAAAAIVLANGKLGFLNHVVGCVLLGNATAGGTSSILATTEGDPWIVWIQGSTLVAEALDYADLDDSIYWNPVADGGLITAWYSDVPPGLALETSISADPQFANLAADDVHLLATSPCRNAAEPTSLPSHDIDGDPRPLEGHLDMGADEFADDCNGNGQKDWEDLLAGTSVDCDGNGLPDECEPFVDCNGNGVGDACDIATGASSDCNGNGLPDDCESLGDCNRNGVPDICEGGDCNGNGIPDVCDIFSGSSLDLDGNGVPDECHHILYVPTDKPTLAAAVAAASSGDTILLEPGVHSGPGNHDVGLYKHLLVAGATNASECILDAMGEGRILSVNWPTSITLRGLTLRGGVASGGAAIDADQQVSLHVVDCNFFDNSALSAKGGALRVQSTSSVELEGCVFAGNDAAHGGAIAVQGSGCQLVATACTFEGNAATGGQIGSGKGGSLRLLQGATATFRDCILRGGSAASGKELENDSGTLLDVAWCDVAGGQAGIPALTGAVLLWGAGNIDADPLFKDASALDFRLSGGSPCIDSGEPAQPLDADGTPPDMGALPFQPFEDVGYALAGVLGSAQLAGAGTGAAGTSIVLTLSGAPPGAITTLVLGEPVALLPFKGGVMVPLPDVLLGLMTVGGLGSLELAGTLPAGLPSGLIVALQFWWPDAGGTKGLAASNGLTLEVR